MTGAYVRIQRDGKWLNIEIDRLTNAELQQFMRDHHQDAFTWAVFLAGWIRDNIKEQK